LDETPDYEDLSSDSDSEDPCLETRLAELEGDSSPAIRDAVAYTKHSLADGNASSGIDLLPLNVYMPTPKALPPTKGGRKPAFIASNRSQRRRQSYKFLQSMYKRNRKQAASIVLDDAPIHLKYPEVEITEKIFRGRFSRPSPPDEAAFTISRSERLDMSYITSNDIEKCRASMKKNNAPGPDREVNMDLLLRLELPVLELIFNTWFVLQQVPAPFKMARTILLPKSGDTSDPNNWRPITICSLIGRLYAKLLAGRLSLSAALSERQKAFVPVDGCGQNTAILSTVIAHSHKAKKPVHIAFLDLAKAFDTVPHTSIIRALRRKALPQNFVAIIQDLYTDATTSISVGDKSTSTLPMTSGVKQGCPLSPILFNLVLDELIQNIGEKDGLIVNDSKVAILAFADDLVLISGTEDGLAANLHTCEVFFNDRSMRLNAKKSMSLSLVRAHGRKSMLTDGTPKWKVYGEDLPAIQHTQEIKYLGVRYTAAGRPIAKFPKLDEWLKRLKRAPLKPQQRIQIIRSTITQRMIHTLRLCRVNTKLLRNLDRKIRTFVKSVLHLPPGTSTAFFYIPVSMGGLGLPEFMSLIPAAKLKLIEKMMLSSDPIVVEAVGCEHWLKELRWCHKVTSQNGDLSEAKAARVERYTTSYTGKTQSGFALLPGHCNWLEGGTRLTGNEYVVGCHLMSNTLPVRTRTFRGGTNQLTTCRYCPGVPETPSHALQSCPIVRDAVTKRHNVILTKLQQFLTPNFDSVIREPWFNGAEGRLNPDLVLIQGKLLYVVDLTVPYDSTVGFMDFQAQKKETKYLVLESLLKTKFKVDMVRVLGLAIGARGLYTERGSMTAKTLGLSLKQQKLLSSIAFRQTCAIWGLFNNRRRPEKKQRTGVG
jgi:hypothetical protein